MRRLFLTVTALFWILNLGFWGSSLWNPPQIQRRPAAIDNLITAEELKNHATPENCWMAIRGKVYDLSAYLPEHPSRPDIIQSWCGMEATHAYNTKSKNREHSARADEMLEKYRIGMLGPAKQ